MSKTLTVVEIAEAAQIAATVTAVAMQLQSTVLGLAAAVAAEGGNPTNFETCDADLWKANANVLKRLDKATKHQTAWWKRKGIC